MLKRNTRCNRYVSKLWATVHVLSVSASTHVQCVLPKTSGEQNWWRGAGQMLPSLFMARAVYRRYVHLLVPK
jgi:hypothetical protein